jgi:hypothetical protein
MSWELDAACRGRQHVMLYDGRRPARTAEAVALCNTCPVLEPCRLAALTPLPLDTGLNHRPGYIGDRYEGLVAGNLTPDERKPLLAAAVVAALDTVEPVDGEADDVEVELGDLEPTDAELLAIEADPVELEPVVVRRRHRYGVGHHNDEAVGGTRTRHAIYAERIA